MKKFVLVLVIALSVTGMVSAQNRGNGWGYSETVTVTGTLQLQNGTTAVANGNTVYYVPALERYIGFIDGLKEGAQISIDGYTLGNRNSLQPVKVVLNGKTYDFTPNASQGMMYNGWRNAGYGSCCW
ncbi:hypothetical protein FACS1894172_04560 [Spirochaetia bacterium]|nr:hypothetical protein FACS1894172_04560 [Spirochaetia bacterium]